MTCHTNHPLRYMPRALNKITFTQAELYVIYFRVVSQRLVFSHSPPWQNPRRIKCRCAVDCRFINRQFRFSHSLDTHKHCYTRSISVPMKENKTRKKKFVILNFELSIWTNNRHTNDKRAAQELFSRPHSADWAQSTSSTCAWVPLKLNRWASIPNTMMISIYLLSM